MASKRAVATCLALLNEAFAGDMTDERVRVYHAALADVDDDMLKLATAHVIRTYTNAFMPPPAVLIAAAMPAVVAIDSTTAIHHIRKLGEQHPTAGYCAPSVARVRSAIGEHAAYAYAAAGGPDRVFSHDETSRDIAARDFQKALTEAMRRPYAPLPILTSIDGALQIVDARDVSKQLRAGGPTHETARE